MGTNYYIKKTENLCEHCGRGDTTEIHVGKQSWGWAFCFNPKFETFREWKKFLMEHPDSLYDEYGNKIELKEFFKIVKETKGMSNYPEGDYLDKDGYRFSKFKEFS